MSGMRFEDYVARLTDDDFEELFANIEEVEPDEVDLMMLKEIENNPDCHEFISQEELMKELNL